MIMKCVRCGREIKIDPDDSRVSMHCNVCEQKACIERAQRRRSKPAITHLSLGDHMPRRRAARFRGRSTSDFSGWS